LLVAAISLIAVLYALAGRDSGDVRELAPNVASGQELQSNPERERLFGALSGEERRGIVIPPEDFAELEDRPAYSGQWFYRDGMRLCDGYLTRFEDDEYCSSEVPSDWVPFEFEGNTYYVQPLSANGG